MNVKKHQYAFINDFKTYSKNNLYDLNNLHFQNFKEFNITKHLSYQCQDSCLKPQDFLLQVDTLNGCLLYCYGYKIRIGNNPIIKCPESVILVERKSFKLYYQNNTFTGKYHEYQTEKITATSTLNHVSFQFNMSDIQDNQNIEARLEEMKINLVNKLKDLDSSKNWLDNLTTPQRILFCFLIFDINLFIGFFVNRYCGSSKKQKNNNINMASVPASGKANSIYPTLFISPQIDLINSLPPVGRTFASCKPKNSVLYNV